MPLLKPSAHLPLELTGAIDERLEGIEAFDLAQASLDLTRRYRSRTTNKFMVSDAHRLAYLAARLPATYAVNYKVLRMLAAAEFSISSLLDLGAGPGTVMWASVGLWPDLEKISLIEADQGLIHIGKHLSKSSDLSSIQNATWRHANLTTLTALDPHDVLSLSYVLTELDPQDQLRLVQLSWQAIERQLTLPVADY